MEIWRQRASALWARSTEPRLAPSERGCLPRSREAHAGICVLQRPETRGGDPAPPAAGVLALRRLFAVSPSPATMPTPPRKQVKSLTATLEVACYRRGWKRHG